MKSLSRVGIVGVGLIGASLGMAMRQRRLAGRVLGVDVDAGALTSAKERGAIDAAGTLAQLADADLVIVAVPPESVVTVISEAAQHLRAGAIVTDVASTKSAIVRELEGRLPDRVRYVGSHPMAGSEGHGPAEADAALFEGRPFVVTPTARTDPAAVAAVAALGQGLGMRPLMLTPEEHDELVAQVSHLPYLLTVAAVNAVGDDAARLQGPAFAALARVAGSPPALWMQICRQNRAAIRRALARFARELERLDRALDGDRGLEELLRQAQQKVHRDHGRTGPGPMPPTMRKPAGER